MRKAASFVALMLSAINAVGAGRVDAQAAGDPTAATIGAPFVTVEGRSQLHSQQIFGSDAVSLLDRIDAEVRRVAGQLVKLHFVAVDNASVDSVRAAMAERYANRMPAVTCVVGKLADAKAKLGADAVVALPQRDSNRARVSEDPWGRVLAPGARVYISGQAEKASGPAEATRLTLESLKRTLEWLGASLDDIVQVKAFLAPIDAADQVRTELAKFVGDRQVPLVLVEWSSTLPIEIELIAAAPPAASDAATVEYLTPPGMTASPIYCRVAKINAAETIYIGGLTAPGAKTAEQEVTQIFRNLEAVLSQSGSDLKHLVKATYYVASDEASSQLNALRPRYYDAKRPPAASKAVVAGVGRPGCNLTLDMIGVRSTK